MTEYIVELEKRVWIAPWTGDPGRTVVIKNARRFKKKSSAFRSLAYALDQRDFDDPKVIPAPEENKPICPECQQHWPNDIEKCPHCGHDIPF